LTSGPVDKNKAARVDLLTGWPVDKEGTG